MFSIPTKTGDGDMALAGRVLRVLDNGTCGGRFNFFHFPAFLVLSLGPYYFPVGISCSVNNVANPEEPEWG